MSIESDINEGLQPIADQFGKEIVAELRKELISHGKQATGTLVKGLESKVRFDGARAVIEVFAEDYFRFVDQGRKPGRFPPVDKIKAWLRVKGISEKAAFPIGRKIATEGIKGIKILNPTIDSVTVAFLPKYESEMEKILGAVMVNDIFSATNTKGQILPKSLRIT